ncbi:hypothetical protein M885DRAFT_532035 [Pelagophyceae sp. CCMP2097]|nr:hypothetical protein M885DRAFT_532035 [Pelagophyceae sp. CCMP2097]
MRVLWCLFATGAVAPAANLLKDDRLMLEGIVHGCDEPWAEGMMMMRTPMAVDAGAYLRCGENGEVALVPAEGDAFDNHFEYALKVENGTITSCDGKIGCEGKICAITVPLGAIRGANVSEGTVTAAWAFGYGQVSILELGAECVFPSKAGTKRGGLWRLWDARPRFARPRQTQPEAL